MNVYNEGKEIQEFRKETELQVLNSLRNAADAEQMRTWAKKTFGVNWTQSVLGF